jgi:hypothetical protein
MSLLMKMSESTPQNRIISLQFDLYVPLQLHSPHIATASDL